MTPQHLCFLPFSTVSMTPPVLMYSIVCASFKPTALFHLLSIFLIPFFSFLFPHKGNLDLEHHDRLEKLVMLVMMARCYCHDIMMNCQLKFSTDICEASITCLHQAMFRTSGHKKTIRDSFLCAGYEEGKKDSCEVRSALMPPCRYSTL